MKIKYAMGIVAIALAAFLSTGTCWADGKRDGGPNHGCSRKIDRHPGNFHQGDHGHNRPKGHALGHHKPNQGHHYDYGHRQPHNGNGRVSQPCHSKEPRPSYKHHSSGGAVASAAIRQPGFSLAIAIGDR